MLAQFHDEQESHRGHSYWVVIKDIFGNRSNLQRFILAVMLFLFHKFTGTDSLNYYAPRIFNMIGVGEGSNSLLTTGVYGVVKFITTIFYVGFLVDRIGRRLPLIIGATLQATAMLYLALYLRFAAPSPGGQGGTPAGGVVGVIWIYIYAFGWSFGHSVACYVVAAEIFPTRIRSFCMSICFFINWIVDYGITRATPNMLSSMGWGTFLLYSMLTYLGVVFVFFCMPETKVSFLRQLLDGSGLTWGQGRSIESMDDLFQYPLWMMWKHAYPKTEEEKVRHGVQDAVLEKPIEDASDPEKLNVTSKHIEN